MRKVLGSFLKTPRGSLNLLQLWLPQTTAPPAGQSAGHPISAGFHNVCEAAVFTKGQVTEGLTVCNMDSAYFICN